MGGSMMCRAQDGEPLGVVATAIGAPVDVMKVDEATMATPRHRAPAMMPTFNGPANSRRDGLRRTGWALVYPPKMLGVALRQFQVLRRQHDLVGTGFLRSGFAAVTHGDGHLEGSHAVIARPTPGKPCLSHPFHESIVVRQFSMLVDPSFPDLLEQRPYGTGHLEHHALGLLFPRGAHRSIAPLSACDLPFRV
jgi:hypothetical protein